MIIDRIRAHGGDVIRDGWRLRLRPGRMTPEAVEWVRAHMQDLAMEVWPEFDRFQELASMLEYDDHHPREVAERLAYERVMA